jgi:uncharacterized membrane protein SpoIIM required for sporulation
MTAARFLETRRPAWDRLEHLLRRAGRRGARALEDRQVRELARLYPGVAVDVARARMYGLDPLTVRRVNQLAVAAHGLLYRRPRGRPLRAVGRFFAAEYPRLLRRLWPFVALAATLFLAGALGAYVTARLRPATAYLFVEHGLDFSGDEDQVTPEDVSERYRQAPGSPMSAFIVANNIRVALVSFALGVTAGLGTCYVLFVNAMMLGAFIAHFENHNLGYVCWSFLAPHGVLEVLALIISGGAGLRLGLALAVPGRLSRGASLRVGAREAALLFLGTMPMFGAAALVEGFVTPSPLPGFIKVAFGVLLGATALAYLLVAGRGPPRAAPRDAARLGPAWRVAPPCRVALRDLRDPRERIGP